MNLHNENTQNLNIPCKMIRNIATYILTIPFVILSYMCVILLNKNLFALQGNTLDLCITQLKKSITLHKSLLLKLSTQTRNNILKKLYEYIAILWSDLEENISLAEDKQCCALFNELEILLKKKYK